MTTPKAIIYTRVSSDIQAQEGTSLQTQEQACLRKAADMGAQVVGVFRDEGVSGALYAARPGMQAALCLIEAGNANLFICANLSRFSRDSEHQQAIKKRIETAGGRLILCDMQFDATPEGGLAFGIMGNFAQYERETIRKRTMQGRKKRTEEGIQVYRNVSPMGYHIVTKEDILRGNYLPGTVGTYQIMPEQAVYVRELFARCASGSSLNGLANWLTEQGIATPQGGYRWHRSSLRAILRNPVYKGVALVGRKEVIHDEQRVERGYKMTYTLRDRAEEDCISVPVPSLVDVEVWEKCQNRLAGNKARLSGNPNCRYMLSGLLRCPVCGGGMVGATFRGTQAYFCKTDNRCEGDGKHKRGSGQHKGSFVEAAVIKVLHTLAHNPALLETVLQVYIETRRTTPDTGTQNALLTELNTLSVREKVTVQAQIAGIEAGADPTLYAEQFAAIAAKRKELQTRLASFQAQAQTPCFNPKDTAAIVAQAAADVELVLTACDAEVSAAEKHDVLARIIHAIRPKSEEIEIEIAALPGSGLTVQQVLS